MLMDVELICKHIGRELEAVKSRENSVEKTATIAALEVMRCVFQKCGKEQAK